MGQWRWGRGGCFSNESMEDERVRRREDEKTRRREDERIAGLSGIAGRLRQAVRSRASLDLDCALPLTSSVRLACSLATHEFALSLGGKEDTH